MEPASGPVLDPFCAEIKVSLISGLFEFNVTDGEGLQSCGSWKVKFQNRPTSKSQSAACFHVDLAEAVLLTWIRNDHIDISYG